MSVSLILIIMSQMAQILSRLVEEHMVNLMIVSSCVVTLNSTGSLTGLYEATLQPFLEILSAVLPPFSLILVTTLVVLKLCT